MRKLFLIFLIFSIVLTGCGPSNTESKSVDSHKIHSKREITRVDIIFLFPKKYIVFNDELYATFNGNYRAQWHSEFLKILDSLGLTPKWRTDFDCDSFAMLKAAVGQTLYPVHSFHETKNAKNVAIGEFFYIVEKTKNGHAINVVIEDVDNQLVVKYVDIYTGAYMNLTQSEIDSAFFIRF